MEQHLRQGTTGSDITAVLPGVNQSFPSDVEAEANSYFQKIYNQPPNPTMTIDEVLEMLKTFKDSSSKKEKDVFLCMLRNLFEEYGNFHNYPNRKLHTTACLFGGIIDQGLVTYMALGKALRYVLDALRKPFQSKMYIFGITALDRFRLRLKDYQNYCRHLASIPHFNEFPPHLIEFIDYGKQSSQPPLSSRSLQDVTNDLAYVAPKLAAEQLCEKLNERGLSNDAHIIDLGCGTGLVGEQLHKLGCKNVDGVDISPESIRIAEAKGIYRALHCGYMASDECKDLGIEVNQYDAAICIGVFTVGHVKGKGFDDLVHVVKPGGLACLTIRESVANDPQYGYNEKMNELCELKKWRLVSKSHIVYHQTNNYKSWLYFYEIL